MDLVTHLAGKKREINVTTQCALILLLFSEKDNVLSYSKIKEMVGLDEVELERCLLSMSCGKIKLLNKNPKSRSISSTDQFSVNWELNIPTYRIKIPMIVNKKTVTLEIGDTREKVDEERRDIIDAAIVRIMKSRKTLSHNELVSEVIQQLSQRFMPSPALIKKRIEILLEREYLVRDHNDRRVYNYCA